MKLIGTFTEAQLAAGEDKAACEMAEKNSGGALRYFITKFIPSAQGQERNGSVRHDER